LQAVQVRGPSWAPQLLQNFPSAGAPQAGQVFGDSVLDAGIAGI
jgi:hypothetical protein